MMTVLWWNDSNDDINVCEYSIGIIISNDIINDDSMCNYWYCYYC